MAGIELPVRAIRQQASSALDLIVHLDRMDDGSRKVSHITEVQRMESDVITLQDLFEYKIESVAPDRTITGPALRDRSAARLPAQVPEARHRAARRALPAGTADDARLAGGRSMRKLAALAVAALAAVVAALPALAAESGPTLSESAAGSPTAYYVLTLPKPQRLTAGERPRHRRTAMPVTNLAVTRPARAGFVTILVIDASNSMRGKPIADAMKAARAFAARRNPNSPLGVIFFNDDVGRAPRPPRTGRRSTRRWPRRRSSRRRRTSTTRSTKAATSFETAAHPAGRSSCSPTATKSGAAPTQRSRSAA